MKKLFLLPSDIGSANFLTACAFHLVLLTKLSFITKTNLIITDYGDLKLTKTDILVLNLFCFFKWIEDNQRGMLS